MDAGADSLVLAVGAFAAFVLLEFVGPASVRWVRCAMCSRERASHPLAIALCRIDGVVEAYVDPSIEYAWLVRERGLSWARRMEIERLAAEAMGARWSYVVVTRRSMVPGRVLRREGGWR